MKLTFLSKKIEFCIAVIFLLTLSLLQVNSALAGLAQIEDDLDKNASRTEADERKAQQDAENLRKVNPLGDLTPKQITAEAKLYVDDVRQSLKKDYAAEDKRLAKQLAKIKKMKGATPEAIAAAEKAAREASAARKELMEINGLQAEIRRLKSRGVYPTAEAARIGAIQERADAAIAARLEKLLPPAAARTRLQRFVDFMKG